MRQKQGKLNTTSLCFLIGLSLAGCRDFGTVKTLGDRANAIRDHSQKIATDFYDSCIRRARIPETRFPGIVDTRRLEEQQCEPYEDGRDAIVTANEVLATYLENLGKLAGNSAIKPESQELLEDALDSLSTTAGQTGVAVPAPIGAIVGQGSTILQRIFDAVAYDIRRNTIIPVMICTDDAIYGYTQGLKDIATSSYINQLNIEAVKYDGYFRNLEPPSPDQNLMPSEAFHSLQLDREYNEIMNSLSQKRTYAQDFADFLEETRETHRNIARIFAESRHLTRLNDKKELEIIPDKREAFCKDYETRSREDMASIQLTPSQVEQIANILKDYEITTNSLLEKMKRVDFIKQPSFLHDR